MGSLTEMPETSSLNGLVCTALWINARFLHEIASDVLDEEVIVGNIGIEGADDIVTVALSFWDGEVLLVAPRFREANEV